MPRILGRTLELRVVQASSETEQHLRWRGDAQAVVSLDDIAPIDPRTECCSQPVGQHTSLATAGHEFDRPLRHPAQPVEAPSRRTVEEAVAATEQLGGHRSLAKRRREVGQLDDTRKHRRQNPASLGSAEGALGDAHVDELANGRDTELAGEQPQRFGSVEYSTGKDVFHASPGRAETAETETDIATLVDVMTLASGDRPMNRRPPRSVGPGQRSVWRR